jgi:predicted dehydrogenase
MKILVAGLGSIGRRHLRHLLALRGTFPEELEIRLFRSRRSTLPGEELEGLPVETDLTSALAWRPAAVVIATPTALHLQTAIPAAEAGCHLLLEKPVSHNIQGIPELRSALQRGGGQVQVGYQFRFHPGLQKVRLLLEEGAIGRPLSARAHWGEWLPGWHPWEDYRQGYSARADLGGGVILTLSHPLDYLGWLFGEVEAVWAFAGKLSDLELAVEDTAEIGLRFRNGMLGSLHLDYLQRPASHRLEVTGSEGTIHWDNAGGSVRLYSALPEFQEKYVSARPGKSSGKGDQNPQFRDTGETAVFHPPAGFDRDELFRAQMRHFLELACGRAAPACTLEDGVRALELALAALQSQEQGAMIYLNRKLSSGEFG